VKRIAIAVVILAALAGCSSPAPLTLAQVATKAGCEGAATPGAQVGTTGAAKCTKGGHDLYLYTFADDSARDNWLKVAKNAGALGSFQQGTSWVIQTM
jgi:hypothetical protein